LKLIETQDIVGKDPVHNLPILEPVLACNKVSTDS